MSDTIPSPASPKLTAGGPRSDAADRLDALRKRDAKAFEWLVREFGPRMLAVTRRYLRDESDAQDALQDAFISCYRALDRFDGRSQLSTWLHTIACRAALMKLRAKRRTHEEGDLDALLPTYKPDGHRTSTMRDWPDQPDVAAERAETRQLVRQCIDELPDGYREVLLLRDIDGYETDEAAECLGLNPNALKTRLHRARMALRTLLARRLALAEGGDQ
ncbi:MAG: sigma-70 family RNA polymerase sigma factor [Tepidisphaeraceae bacterium]